jgi:hypothetical protein
MVRDGRKYRRVERRASEPAVSKTGRWEVEVKVKVSIHDKKVSIVQVDQDREWRDKEKYKEWIKYHYADLHFEALKGQAHIMLLNYMLKRQHLFW